MMQTVGALALGLVFLMISPNLRATLIDGLGAVGDELQRWGALTYLSLAVIAIGGLLAVFARESAAQGKQPFRYRTRSFERTADSRRRQSQSLTQSKAGLDPVADVSDTCE